MHTIPDYDLSRFQLQRRERHFENKQPSEGREIVSKVVVLHNARGQDPADVNTERSDDVRGRSQTLQQYTD